MTPIFGSNHPADPETADAEVEVKCVDRVRAATRCFLERMRHHLARIPSAATPVCPTLSARAICQKESWDFGGREPRARFSRLSKEELRCKMEGAYDDDYMVEEDPDAWTKESRPARLLAPSPSPVPSSPAFSPASYPTSSSRDSAEPRSPPALMCFALPPTPRIPTIELPPCPDFASLSDDLGFEGLGLAEYPAEANYPLAHDNPSAPLDNALGLHLWGLK